MYTRYFTMLALAGVLGISAGPVFAHSNDQSAGGNSGYGSMSTMGSGAGSMMGSGSESMMGSGAGSMMGSGAGSTMGSGSGSTAGTMAGGSSSAGSQELGADYLDQLGDRITERYELMQRIASEKDKTARRKLVRQYVEDVHGYRGANRMTPMRSGGAGYRSPGYGGMGFGGSGYGMMPYGAMGGMMGYGPGGYGMMGPGMGGYGGMGYGMMGPGAGRYGRMGPGMMGYGPMGYGTMGPGMMGYGPTGYGAMGPGMMGYGGMSPAMMRSGQLSDEQLDRMADLMAEGYKTMQEVAQTKDKAERRKLLRDHFDDMREFWQNPEDE